MNILKRQRIHKRNAIEYINDCIKVYTSSGESFLIDRQDEWVLNDYRWFISKGYVMAAATTDKGKTTIRLHRLILSPPYWLHVDHISMDTTDNRRANLRVCTSAENKRNSTMPRTNTTGYKGIFRSGNSWRARIKVNYIPINLGSYRTKEDAYAAYCAAALIYHGEFARVD